jgi:hypothetical protein
MEMAAWVATKAAPTPASDAKYPFGVICQCTFAHRTAPKTKICKSFIEVSL